jgi:hypothetical protein
MYQQLMDVIHTSGIWKGARASSHAFRLSPSVFSITRQQRDELKRLGFALNDCLLGLSHIAVIAYDQSLNYSGPWTKFRKVFSTGVPKVYQQLQGMNTKDVCKLLKVDLMMDVDGNFKIAEIDGHNKHGLGYSTLGKRFRQALYPDALALPGAVKLLAAEVARQGFDHLKLFYADQERFYVPEFEVARQEFQAEGGTLLLLPEEMTNLSMVQSGLFLDLPFLYHNTNLYDPLIAGYRAGEVRFVIPPKPFMGAKGVLALLRNDEGDPDVEAVLRAFITVKSLELVRSYIPETYLVGQHALSTEQVQALVAAKKYVLKESISSGMKGTVFSDEAIFSETLRGAAKTNLNWVLQEEVLNQPQEFSWYEAAGNRAPVLHTADDWFMRVTVQYVSSQLADVIVTARRDKAVHGAKDCIQIGTVIV